jgi:hypothetical protein
MKVKRYIEGEFLRVRIKKNGSEWTTVSIERDLVELVKKVFCLSNDDEVKEFVKRLTNGIDFDFKSYSQAVKSAIYKTIGDRWDMFYSKIQPDLFGE